MDRNSANCQNSAWTAELMVAMQIGSGYWLEFVSCEWANGFENRQKKLRENQYSQSWGCWRFNVKKIYKNCASRTVTDAVVTKTDNMKITICYATAHAELAAEHWLMCQGSGRGSMGLSKFECWILMMLAAVLLRSRQAVQRGPRWTKERDTVPIKLNYKMNHSATFKRTKSVIHPLQPSCDA